jgi:hypothetical protein
MVFILLTAVAIVLGQSTQRCDLGSPRIPGTRDKDTLDLDRIDGQTINVPGNVTRIARDAFAFHKGNTSVDIVYVLDHSTSMEVDGYWESADGATKRYIRESSQLIANGSYSFSECGQRQISYGGGFSSKVVTKVCGSYDPIIDELVSGDPFGSGSYAVREAIGEQARLAPHSRAAYLPFDVLDMEYAQLPLVDLQTSSNVNGLFDMIDAARNDFVGTTDYTQPLEKAKEWLSGSANPVIFFITDLRPTENGISELTSYMQNYPIPVYGVFIGIQEPTAVKDIFMQSGNGGGNFYHISPEHSDSLKHILKQFVGDLLAWSPSSGLVENRTNGMSAAASGAGAFTAQAGFTLMNTAHEVALQEGANQVHVTVEFASTDGQKEVREATFTVNVGGVPESAFTEDLLGIYCGPPSTIAITDQAYTPVGALEEATTFGIDFTTAPSYVGNAADIALTTAIDNETRSLAVSSSGSGVGGRQTYNLLIGDGGGSPGNGMVEARSSDELTARWQHPYDPRDTALASASISQGISIAVTSAVYKDGRGDTADGCVDTILLYLDQASVLKAGGLDITLLNEWKNQIGFGGDMAGLTVERAVKLSDTRVNLVIAHNTALVSGEQSMTITSPPVEVDGFLSWASTNRIADGIAPVAVSASYYLAADENGTDTLSVRFSEPVSFAGTGTITPFALKHGSSEYLLDLEQLSRSGSTVRFLVRGEPRVRTGTASAAHLPAAGDSLSLFPAQVREQAGGNPQTYRVNRRVTLGVTGAFDWKPVAHPNPFNPLHEWSPALQSTFGAGRGAIIMVQTRTKLAGLGALQGSLAIYDPVGNLVWSDDEPRTEKARTFFVWPGHNHSGRVVGSDAYLAVVTITTPEGAEESQRLSIGVSR